MHCTVAALCFGASALCFWREMYFVAAVNAFLCAGNLRGAQVAQLLNLIRSLREAQTAEILALTAVNHVEIGRAIAEHLAREMGRAQSGEPQQPRTLQ